VQRRIFTPLVIAASILVSVAIFGYLIGHSRSSAAPAEGVREASNAVGSLDYPSTSGWRPAPAAPRIPGLSIAQPLVLAPEGDTSRAGLIAGQFVENGSLPLPRR
jgi:hypothetical protein